MDGGAKAKFISKAFLLPKKDLVSLAKQGKVVGADKMTVFQVLSALKLIPTNEMIQEYATTYGIKVSRADNKEKLVRSIRRYHFARKG